MWKNHQKQSTVLAHKADMNACSTCGSADTGLSSASILMRPFQHCASPYYPEPLLLWGRTLASVQDPFLGSMPFWAASILALDWKEARVPCPFCSGLVGVSGWEAHAQAHCDAYGGFFPMLSRMKAVTVQGGDTYAVGGTRYRLTPSGHLQLLSH